jgi:hypothetical protein
MVKESAAHCNAGFFIPIVVTSGYFGYVGYHAVECLVEALCYKPEGRLFEHRMR